jgi:SAM-dependent methyltransferase
VGPWIRPSTYPAKLYWSWRYVGGRATALAALLKLVERVIALVRPGLWYQHLTERAFDRRHGVDTYAFVQVRDMADLSDAQRAAMHEYGPTRAMDFGPLIAGLDLDLSAYAFLDVGSGKGKALLLAAAFPFRRIEGVELSAALHETAAANIAAYRGPRHHDRIASHAGDALTHPLPEGPLLVFMFNPFPAEVVSAFLDRLVRDTGTDRHVLVVYGNGDDEQRALLRRHPGLDPVVDGDDHYVVHERNGHLRRTARG